MIGVLVPLLLMATPGSVERVALVVGNNTPLPGRQVPLRFADDDAYKSAQVLSSTGVKVWLHTRFDEETAERTAARGLVGTPRPPSMEALQQSLREIKQHLVLAKQQQKKTVFYFWYAGHGDIIDGEGAVSLENGTLRRSVLWQEVIAQPNADQNHVIIDACRAYFVVFDRGVTAPRRPVGNLAVAPIPEQLARRTGVLLATAGAEKSYEWEAVHSGIFGHELRSGLSGGADVNGDGEITYMELAAFVQSANSNLPDPAFRPQVTIRPPEASSQLVDLRQHGGSQIVLQPDLRRHLFVEDALGMRWIDLHPEGSAEIRVWLPKGTQPGYLVSVDDKKEAKLYRASGHQIVALADLKPRHSRARGAADDAFEHLFGRPHGELALTAYEASIEGQKTSTPYAKLVITLTVPLNTETSPNQVAPQTPVAPPKTRPKRRLTMVQRESKISDRLPLMTGGMTFIAEPEQGEATHVKLFLGSSAISYEKFASLALDDGTRQQISQETDHLYDFDSLRAWIVMGVGGLSILGGSGSAIYAFASGMALGDRLVYGLGGLNVALAGLLLIAAGLTDHAFIALSKGRDARIAVDPTLLQQSLDQYNNQE